MLQPWTSFLRDEGSSILYELRRLSVLTRVIQNIAPDSKATILEVGCGSAIAAFGFGEHGYSVFALDIDSAVIDWVKSRYCFFNQYVRFCVGDMRQLPFLDHSIDVAYSQGVLEHYHDSGITDALREQGRVARIVVFDVPNRRHGPLRLRGDERLLPMRHYRALCEAAGLHVESIYGRRWIKGLRGLPDDLFYWQPWLAKFGAQTSIFVCRPDAGERKSDRVSLNSQGLCP